jgi:hypothetical protein
MRPKLKFLTKSEVVSLLAERLEDRTVPADLWLRYVKVWDEFTSRKRVPGWAEKLIQRVERIERDYAKQVVAELHAEDSELRRSLEQ